MHSAESLIPHKERNGTFEGESYLNAAFAVMRTLWLLTAGALGWLSRLAVQHGRVRHCQGFLQELEQ